MRPGAGSRRAGGGFSLRSVRRLRRPAARVGAAAVCQEGEANAPQRRSASAITPAARPIACAAAMDAISRSRRSDNQSRAASCNSFCPASETKLVYGSTIDSAATETGKPYSELPNAFRYRSEIVAGCTCNGKDQLALPGSRSRTIRRLRKGDIVASADGLMVGGPRRRQTRRRAELLAGPARISARYQRAPGWRRSSTQSVMAGLVPAIHVFLRQTVAVTTWMSGTRPGMTT